MINQTITDRTQTDTWDKVMLKGRCSVCLLSNEANAPSAFVLKEVFRDVRGGTVSGERRITSTEFFG